MKDSGIPWIGAIPEHWKVEKAKNMFSLRTSKGNDVLEHLAATQTHGMYPQRLLEGVVQVAINTDYTQFRTVHKNDYVISLRSFQGGFEISEYEGVCSPAYQVFYNQIPICHNYFKVLFKSVSFIEFMNSLTVGIREGKNIQFTDFARSYIPVPPLAEQERIASYLDAKCGEIDELIDVEQQMITDLESYRQAVITEAVTHGLNPSENNTDSGVYWIGYVPSKWHIAKMKYFITITNGSDPKTEGDVPVYGSGASSFKTCGEFKEGPTVLIGRKGATLHIPHYIEGRYWNVDTAFDTRVNNFNLRYFYYLASSLDYRAYISATTLPSMTQSNYENMLIPVPPLAEQQEIAEYLDTKCSEIDELIKVKQEKIETLKQYRQSLIFEAVTGKITIA